LREVSDRTLELIAQKDDAEKRSLVGAVIGRVVGIGETVAGMLSRAETRPKKRPMRKTEAAKSV
jgi:hypothetical protein